MAWKKYFEGFGLGSIAAGIASGVLVAFFFHFCVIPYTTEYKGEVEVCANPDYLKPNQSTSFWVKATGFPTDDDYSIEIYILTSGENLKIGKKTVTLSNKWENFRVWVTCPELNWEIENIPIQIQLIDPSGDMISSRSTLVDFKS